MTRRLVVYALFFWAIAFAVMYVASLLTGNKWDGLPWPVKYDEPNFIERNTP